MDNISRLSQEAEQIKKKKGYFISPYEWNEMMKMARCNCVRKICGVIEQKQQNGIPSVQGYRYCTVCFV